MQMVQRWAAAALVASCAAAGSAHAKEVDVKVKNLEEVRMTRDGATFVVALEVKRLGGPDLRLREGSATVKVGDTRLPPVDVDFDGLTLAQGKTKTVRVPVRVTSDAARAVAGQLLSGRDVDVSVHGEVKAWVYYVIPVRRSFHARVEDLGL